MKNHKICFYGEVWKIIPKLSLLPISSGALSNFTIFTSVSVLNGRQLFMFGMLQLFASKDTMYLANFAMNCLIML